MTDNSIIPNIPKVRSGVETYIVPDGSCFLFDPASDISYTLDQLGALVWDYCDGQASVGAIIQEIANLVPEDRDIPARVRGLLADFASEGLLEFPRPAIEGGAGDD